MKNPDQSSIALLAHLLRDNPSKQTCHAAAEMLEHLNRRPADTQLASQLSVLNAQMELERISHRRSVEATRVKRKYQLILSIAVGVILGVLSSMAVPSAHSEPSAVIHPPMHPQESFHSGNKGTPHGDQRIQRLI